MDSFCVKHGVKLPSLNDPFTQESEGPRMHPEVSQAVSHIVSAAAQLIAIVRPAPVTLMTTAIQVHVSSALRVAVDSNVVEILREAGSQGLHVRQISAKNGIDSGKLGRILRLLASEHIFNEIAPDTFSNNRISSAIDTGKSFDGLVSQPDMKFIGTNGIAAGISRFTDESVKSSAYLYEALTDPEFSKKADPFHTAFNLAYKTNLPLFPWLGQAGNEQRLRRFGIAIDGGNKMLPPNGILMGYPWSSLSLGSVIVDVGGGIGTESMKIAKEFPSLKLIVQDTRDVVGNGIKYFETQFPEGMSSGRVTFQVHDFLQRQPVTNARVFFLRLILHDWPDETCIRILKNLRDSANPNTELIINECIMDYACPVDRITVKDIPGAVGQTPPSPLLSNMGHARIFNYLIDLQMAIMLNGVERTIEQYAELFQKSGWELKQVFRMPEGHAMLHKIVGVPSIQSVIT
ncbi:S-adenosyl-L-methionine-dependent methyltransferase [Gymnopilus junonius]|uniref:S-adenosyl-L-methionine-dependent methyltransferase n=1 Tax=Gymnopilus junonius TaxID=109634 RepID=A0A9P5NMK4_GYMJU|nr:S-adenosyl-L-methionine-dependent methyltransferase [Gymnopilus junonius]